MAKKTSFKKASKKAVAKKTTAKKAASKKPAAKTAPAKKAPAKKAPVKPTAAASAAGSEGGGLLLPPKGGAVVRMYRIGHGDCFLLAFDGDNPERPVYVLIDCGYKPGSPQMIHERSDLNVVKAVTASIREATGGHIDVAVITHEHQDHVNAITEANFKGLSIGTTWFAWTEDPKDDLANKLREIYKDKLVGLVAARNGLAAAQDVDHVKAIDDFLEFELGVDEDGGFNPSAAGRMLGAAGGGGGISPNKRSMNLFKTLAENRVKTLRPHEEILTIPGAKDLRVYAFGPPRSIEKLQDLDPEAGETFSKNAMAVASAGNYFAAAAIAASEGLQERMSPFSSRYLRTWKEAFTDETFSRFFLSYYGKKGDAPVHEETGGHDAGSQNTANEAPLNADWRRIDTDWLQSGSSLALAMNSDTNNASLVLAFELGKGGKVLLFAGDAQRGNWHSWAEGDWTEDDKKITTKELMSRTVLYKVGHHCSHNATLNGSKTDDYPNISWMATNARAAAEFTSLITAVPAWARTQKGWNHPQKDIKDALLLKGAGRVFQTDTDVDKMEKPKDVPQKEWDAFIRTIRSTDIYFDIPVGT